jgi:succinate-semialdehyde dehydrogenase/glutarate-semialdehyde dehydrogenase
MAAPAKPAPVETPGVSSHLESINPSSGEVIARFETITPSELPRIVERARRVQERWATQPMRERCGRLRRLRDVLYQRREEITEIISRESGKPRFEALTADLMVSLDTADYYSRRLPRLLRSEQVPHHNPAVKAKRARLHYEAMGVIGVISPWNYPLAIPMGLLIPALAAGNAVVLKPSELTPWCGALVGELFEQAGFPADLVQVVQGRGDVGAALIDAKPDKIVFTGSVATGQRVAEACARHLIPSVLELGGKDAMIVLADANLEVASSAAVWGSFTNCGQACLSVERIYVDPSVADRFTELCVAKTKRLRLGPGLDAETEIGPMIRPSAVEKVERQIQDAVARGARVLAGGKRRPDLGDCFIEPTVVTDVDHSMLLMHEETFGPVLAIRAVANAEEAVRLANDSPFGLGASVWTRDTRKGRQIASELKVGAVMINDALSYFGICEAPHGGRGASGWGRTHARLGLLELVQVKYVDEDRMASVFGGKPWWYGYSQQLAVATDRFLESLFAPDWRRRLGSVGGALGTVFRSKRI